jgi:hypothetical protein
LVLIWFLAAYSILRFGLEGLRGDPRPHFLGLSQARWMAMAEMATILWWSEGRPYHGVRLVVFVGLAAVLVSGLALRHILDWRRRILKECHLFELRAAVATVLPKHPEMHVTTGGVRIAASNTGAAFGSEAHISISLPEDRRDLYFLCELAARAFPGISPQAAYAVGGKVLHLLISSPPSLEPADGTVATYRSRALYGAVLRRMRQPKEMPVAPHNDSQGTHGAPQRPWYFTLGETQRG